MYSQYQDHFCSWVFFSVSAKIKHFNISSSYKKYPQRFSSSTTDEEVDTGEREDDEEEEDPTEDFCWFFLAAVY